MEFEASLENSRWTILQQLARKDSSASEIAQATGTSLPNISQQTRLLEAYGLIRAAEEERKGPGKPRRIYALRRRCGRGPVARKGFAGKKTVQLDPFHTAVLNIWFLESRDDHYYLQKFLWQHESLIERCRAVAVVGSKGQELHLLLVTDEKSLEGIRKEYSKIVLASPSGKERSLISWTHTIEEIERGLAEREEYFTKLVKEIHAIIDKEGLLAELKRP